ncbi:hypothetical protein ABPG72_018275 [Tetrahymena utriculariae]
MLGKRAPGEQKFLTYIFRLVLKKGGLRMLMVTGDITKDMQTLDAKDDINLHRKRYGNMDQCLKDIKNPFYIIDSMVIKFKPYNEIVSLHQQGHILDDDFKYYEQVYAENEVKKIQVLKINGLNECINCGQEYKMIVNQDRSCEATQDKHQPKHKY